MSWQTAKRAAELIVKKAGIGPALNHESIEVLPLLEPYPLHGEFYDMVRRALQRHLVRIGYKIGDKRQGDDDPVGAASTQAVPGSDRSDELPPET